MFHWSILRATINKSGDINYVHILLACNDYIVACQE